MTAKPLRDSRTQWTAQFLVAAELTRRGCAVAFTLGNQPGIDLVVTHLRTGAQFFVDVKGNKNRNTWLVEREGKPSIPDLYYILISVDEKREKDQFFIMTQDEARALRDKHKQERGGKGALDPSGKFSGFPFNYPRDFEDRWEKLPIHITTDTEAARPRSLEAGWPTPP